MKKSAIAIASIIVIFIIIFNLLAYFGGFSKKIVAPMPYIVKDFYENIPFIIFAIISGYAGALLKLLISKNFSNEYELAKKSDRFDENAFLIIGSILGVVGYFVLESKIILRIIYDQININDATINFVPLSAISMIFGYFGVDMIVGFKKRILENVIHKVEEYEEKLKKLEVKNVDPK